MRALLTPAILLFACATAAAQSGDTSQCPFTADELSKHFGTAFKAGVPERGILGKGCTYAAGGIKLWLDAGPNPAPSADAYRKMSNPPGTGWAPVAGDPDKAVHVVPKADVSPYPSLSYERKGWLVNLTVTGVSGKSGIDAWNAKLVQLKRIP